jgi:hypothetical protein
MIRKKGCNIFNILFTLIILAILITGSKMSFSMARPEKLSPAEKIQIFPEAPQMPYEVIATVSAKIDIEDSLSPFQAERDALRQLKEQAAKEGANGIIEVYSEVSIVNSVISSVPLGSKTGSIFSPLGSGMNCCGLTSYSIGFRGKAIKFLEKR